jgi:hypothetical protein
VSSQPIYRGILGVGLVLLMVLGAVLFDHKGIQQYDMTRRRGVRSPGAVTLGRDLEEPESQGS